ncbi:MAG TPA: cellulose binding domain-containing protein, partial [Streptosporangiaceae bacterium]|nr:cellulose binding domain-containing protein [Streptosporangiaceae bacterium]
GWTLGFRLPGGASLSSLWNGADTVSGGQVTVTNAGWDGAISPGGSAQIGLVVEGSATAPGNCTIDGAPCQPGGGGAGSPTPSASAPSATTPTPTASPSPSPSPSPSSPAPSPSPSEPAGTTAGFAPYVDTSLFPPFSLTSVAAQTGVKQFNLAFVVSGGGCTPEWGGTTAIGGNPVAAEIGAMGGDVRVSFGGEDGSELAQTCTSVSQLTAAYQQVISAYDLNKIDFDIEGAALDDTAANAVRDQALAQLQAQDPGLQVSFTLPVEPSGLTQDGIDLLDGAVSAGVGISAVNVMAMDYGDASAPDPATMMGAYAIDAATATDAQIAGVLGISDAAAWAKVAVTPMIGQNDQTDEVFTVADAQQLEAFAAAKHLAWLSMWSAGRDTECPGGADTAPQPSCSGIVQTPQEFAETLGQF